MRPQKMKKRKNREEETHGDRRGYRIWSCLMRRESSCREAPRTIKGTSLCPPLWYFTYY